MQADDVSAKAPDLCDLVPDVRVPPPLLGQFVQLAFGLLGLVPLHQQVDMHLAHRVVTRIQLQQTL